MITVKAVRKRMNIALDKYTNYAPHISQHKDLIKIQKQETYWVNLKDITCSCQDFARHGHETPCKHIFMAILFQNSLNHDISRGHN